MEKQITFTETELKTFASAFFYEGYEKGKLDGMYGNTLEAWSKSAGKVVVETEIAR